MSGYRSIRDIRLPLGQVNVLTGPNGCGKSNLYQSLYMVHAAASGGLARTMAEEGGITSLLWAGPRRMGRKSEPVRVTFQVEWDDVAYELSCGLPYPGDPFPLDPEVKEEKLYPSGRPRTLMLERTNTTAFARDIDGSRITFPFTLDKPESVLAQIQEPQLFPQLALMARRLGSWRFYHQFRTDPGAPLRKPQVGFYTPVLDREGQHLAAALYTIRVSGDGRALDQVIDDAFPGSRLNITECGPRYSFSLHMPHVERAFEARELSDGTLRYLCLLAALLSPRPPSLVALNEPETSLHPDLIQPLARLIARASKESQIWITTHSLPLAAAIEEFSGQPRIQLEKVDGETRVVGQKLRY